MIPKIVGHVFETFVLMIRTKTANTKSIYKDSLEIILAKRKLNNFHIYYQSIITIDHKHYILSQGLLPKYRIKLYMEHLF